MHTAVECGNHLVYFPWFSRTFIHPAHHQNCQKNANISVLIKVEQSVWKWCQVRVCQLPIQKVACYWWNGNNFLLRARCANVVHDLGSAEPRSKVELSSRSITLHQIELRSADPVQLNGRG